jgi:hypothetical protein
MYLELAVQLKLKWHACGERDMGCKLHYCKALLGEMCK